MAIEKCPDCFGERIFDSDCGDGKCAECRGTGLEQEFLQALQDAMQGDSQDCDVCNGTGTCQTCDGDGFLNTGIIDWSSPERNEPSPSEPATDEDTEEPYYPSSEPYSSSVFQESDREKNHVQGWILWAAFFAVLGFFLIFIQEKKWESRNTAEFQPELPQPIRPTPPIEAQPPETTARTVDCKSASKIRAHAGDAFKTKHAKFTIFNESQVPLKVASVDMIGYRSFWLDVPPGGSHSNAQPDMFPQIVTDSDGRCIKIFYPPGDVVIKNEDVRKIEEEIPIRSLAPDELAGTWILRPETRPHTIRVAEMKIEIWGDQIVATGDGWNGLGKWNGTSGYYDWTLQKDGQTGRTELYLDDSGFLHGEVRGAGIDWDYIAKRD